MLAAIAGFEALKHPTSQDMRQFSNLFSGLFELTRDDTRRTAAASLSRLKHLPQDIVLMIADQPIHISAPFLALSPCLGDQVLLQTIARHGDDHARAIARREKLSPAVHDALAELDNETVAQALRQRAANDTPNGIARLEETEAKKCHNEEQLRTRLKDMALRRGATKQEPCPARHEVGRADNARLVEAAEAGRPLQFNRLLARCLSADVSLAERIMLDVSGRQLTMALYAVHMQEAEIVRTLIGLFPLLQRTSGGVQHAELLLASVNREESDERVRAWARANDVSSGSGFGYQPQTEASTRRPRETERLHRSGRADAGTRILKQA